MNSIQNLKKHDPFVDIDSFNSNNNNFVHIRIKQRNKKKNLTTVEGLPINLDFKKVAKYIKKTFGCNASIINDAKLGKILQFQGDQRENFKNFLISEGICNSINIKIHGF